MGNLQARCHIRYLDIEYENTSPHLGVKEIFQSVTWYDSIE